MLNMTKKQRYTLEHELGNIYSFNDYLKSFTSSLTCNDALMLDFIENIVALLNELYEENEQLKHQNELLSDELEQCKAVINKKWSEYLKKKELKE